MFIFAQILIYQQKNNKCFIGKKKCLSLHKVLFISKKIASDLLANNWAWLAWLDHRYFLFHKNIMKLGKLGNFDRVWMPGAFVLFIDFKKMKEENPTNLA